VTVEMADEMASRLALVLIKKSWPQFWILRWYKNSNIHYNLKVKLALLDVLAYKIANQAIKRLI
jgi:hypothetical protein